MLVTLTVRRVTKNCIFYRVTLHFNFLRTFSGLSSRIPKPCYQSNLYSRSEGELGSKHCDFLIKVKSFFKGKLVRRMPCYEREQFRLLVT